MSRDEAVRVGEAAGRGRVLLAARSAAPGDVMVMEPPLMLCPPSQPAAAASVSSPAAGDVDPVVMSDFRVFQGLSPDKKREVLDLFCPTDGVAAAGVRAACAAAGALPPEDIVSAPPRGVCVVVLFCFVCVRVCSTCVCVRACECACASVCVWHCLCM